MESFHHYLERESYMRKLGLKPTQSSKTKILQKEGSVMCRSPVVVIEPISKHLRTTLWQLRPAFRNYNASIEFSSKLGQQITSELQRKNNVDTSAYAAVSLEKCERYCCLNYQPPETLPNLRDRNTQTKFPTTFNASRHSITSRTYQFNKTQKDERQKVLATGLDKRSRALKRLCKPLHIIVKPLTKKQIEKFTAHKVVNGVHLPTKLSNGSQFSQNYLQMKISNGSQSPQNRSISVNNVKLESKLHCSYSASKQYAVGKEIEIDGDIVIDLTSDDESDERKVVPCTLISKFKSERKMCITKNLCSKEVTNHLHKTVSKRSVESDDSWERSDISLNLSRAAKLDHCYASNSFVNISEMKNCSLHNHSFNVSERKNNIKCAVILEDVTNLLKKGPNGELLVDGTGIKVSENYFSNSSLCQNSFLKMKDSEALTEKYPSQNEQIYFGDLETFQFAHSIFQRFMNSSKNSKESLLPMITEKSLETTVKHSTSISKVTNLRKRSAETAELTETIDLNLKVKRRREVSLSSENFDIIDKDENITEIGKPNWKNSLKCTKQLFPCADISNSADHENYEDFNSKVKAVSHQNFEFSHTNEHIQKTQTKISQKNKILENISQRQKINYLESSLEGRKNGGYLKLSNSRKLLTGKKMDNQSHQDHPRKSCTNVEYTNGSPNTPMTVFICHECQIRKILMHNVQEHINFHLKFAHNNIKVKLQKSAGKQNVINLEAFPEKKWPIPVH